MVVTVNMNLVVTVNMNLVVTVNLNVVVCVIVYVIVGAGFQLTVFHQTLYPDRIHLKHLIQKNLL